MGRGRREGRVGVGEGRGRSRPPAHNGRTSAVGLAARNVDLPLRPSYSNPGSRDLVVRVLSDRTRYLSAYQRVMSAVAARRATVGIWFDVGACSLPALLLRRAAPSALF